MIGVIATLAVGALVFLVVDSMINLDNKWGEQALPEAAQVELSETDNKMVERSGEVIREVLGENAVETLRNASNKERINLIDTFATQLAEAYGLKGRRVHTVEELEDALRSALADNCGYVIDCALVMDEMVRPMVGGGSHITNFIVD